PEAPALGTGKGGWDEGCRLDGNGGRRLAACAEGLALAVIAQTRLAEGEAALVAAGDDLRLFAVAGHDLPRDVRAVRRQLQPGYRVRRLRACRRDGQEERGAAPSPAPERPERCVHGFPSSGGGSCGSRVTASG